MVTANYITLTDLEAALDKALKPVIDRLDRIEGDLKHVRRRTNQMYDVLEQSGLPMAKEGDDG